jgi:CheY-like chemotaxis protein
MTPAEGSRRRIYRQFFNHFSRQIADLLDGRIRVVSNVGQGSTFTFEIPRRDTQPDYPGGDSLPIIGYEGVRRKILIVDDEALNRTLLQELLVMVGFQSVEASCPAEALSLLHDHFDAVISDIHMPGCDGYTFCQKLRLSAETKDLVVIASSASLSTEDQRLARKSGFSDFLPKPILQEELLEMLGSHLQLKWIYRQGYFPQRNDLVIM